MPNLPRFSQILLIVALIHPGGSLASEVDGLLSRVIEAYGGLDAVLSVAAFRQSGTTFSALRGGEGKMVRSYQYPQRLRMDIQYPAGISESRILDGQQGWRDGQPAKGPMHSAMVLQAARTWLPRLLHEHRASLQDHGTVDTEVGATRRRLELDLGGGLSVIAEIDPGSGRIVHSRGVLKMDQNRMEFATDYEDFRVQEGRLFAFRENHYAMGHNTGTTRIEGIEILDTLPDTLFQPASPMHSAQGPSPMRGRASLETAQ